MSVPLRLYCPVGFYYGPENKVRAILGGVNVGDAVASLWNAHWNAFDPCNTQEEQELHDYALLRYMEPWLMVNASESFTLEDFAAALEGVFSLSIECYDGEDCK